MRFLVLALLLVAAPLTAQTVPAKRDTSQTRIRLQKQKAPPHVDTVRIVRVDTVRITDTLNFYIGERPPLWFPLATTDTVERTRWFVAPIPIPLRSECDRETSQPPAVSGATVTPEPATWLMTATGLVGLAIVAKRRRK